MQYLIERRMLPVAVGEPTTAMGTPAQAPSPHIVQKSPPVKDLAVELIFDDEGVLLVKSLCDSLIYALPESNRQYLNEMSDKDQEIYKTLYMLGVSVHNLTIDHLHAVTVIYELDQIDSRSL